MTGLDLPSDPVVPAPSVFGAMPHHLPPEPPSIPSGSSGSQPAFDTASTQRVSSIMHHPNETGLGVSPSPQPICAPVIGLRPAGPDNQLDIHYVLSDALAKILAAGFQQGGTSGPVASLPTLVQGRLPDRPTTSTHQGYVSSEESDNGEEYPEEMEFSEDEGL